MKNVIFFVCDGLSYDITVDLDQHKTPMPFLNSLRKTGIDCSKAFSQGPYTEAGIMGLMYGRNPLDNGAYLFGMQEWENSTYKAFYDAGYRLFSSYYGSCLPPEMMIKGQYIYPENYFSPMFSRFIKGKLDYYKALYDSEGLKDDDYSVLTRLLSKHFDTMVFWHSEEAEKNDCTGDYQVCEIDNHNQRNCAIANWKDMVLEEQELFKQNPKSYLIQIFDNYSTHFITSRCDVEGLPLKRLFREQREWVIQEYGRLFRQIKRKNARFFLKNRQIPFKPLFCSLKINRKRFLEHIYRTYQAGWMLDTTKMVETNLPQICSSSKAFVRSLFKWVDDCNSEQPFFAYLHCDEFHRPLSFYSHDIADRNLVCSELEDASSYVQNLPKKYKGNIGFDLAARYLDSCLSELFVNLQKRDLKRNTIVVITADHGSSNFGGEVRHTTTNHFFPEQYHIPLIMYDDGIKKQIDSFVNIKDIPFTVLERCGIPVPRCFNGKSFLRDINDHTFVEYAGSGVPDLSRRPVFFQYRDSSICYLLKAQLFEKERSIEVVDFFDLKRDPQQLKNIIKQIDEEKKKELIRKYSNRYNELKENYCKWVTEE